MLVVGDVAGLGVEHDAAVERAGEDVDAGGVQRLVRHGGIVGEHGHDDGVVAVGVRGVVIGRRAGHHRRSDLGRLPAVFERLQHQAAGQRFPGHEGAPRGGDSGKDEFN